MVELKNDKTLEEFLSGDGPRVLEIFVEDCHPCKRIVPVMQSLARRYMNRVKFGRIDIRNSELACDMMDEFDILGVPAVMMMGNGRGGTLHLARTEEQYREVIDLLLEPEETHELEEPARETAKEGCGCPIYY